MTALTYSYLPRKGKESWQVRVFPPHPYSLNASLWHDTVVSKDGSSMIKHLLRHKISKLSD